MDFRVNTYHKSRDALIGSIRSEININNDRRVHLRAGYTLSGNGDGATSYTYLGIVASPMRWRVVGIGGRVATGGHDQIAEICQWGHNSGDIGSGDFDAFGQVTMDNDAGDAWVAGDILYHGIVPFDDFFGLDAPENADGDTWDISGAGAGVKMGVWQTGATELDFLKVNVANSDGIILPFFLIEYDSGVGVV